MRLPNVGAGEADRAISRVVQTEKQTRDGGLAGAGPAEQAEHLARFDAARDVMQDGLGRVCERDVVELDRHGAVWKGRARAVNHARPGFQKLAYPHNAAGRRE